MEELVKEFGDQLKKMSKEEKDLELAKILKRKENAKAKSKEVAKAKKEAGIKQLSIDLKDEEINKFKNLLQKTRYNKTELFIKMMQAFETKLQSQQNQQQNQYNQQQKR